MFALYFDLGISSITKAGNSIVFKINDIIRNQCCSAFDCIGLLTILTTTPKDLDPIIFDCSNSGDTRHYQLQLVLTPALVLQATEYLLIIPLS